MVAHVRPETPISGGSTVLVLPDGRRVQADAVPHMLEALKLALEYWAHRQQRYKNRHPVWVSSARKAIAEALFGPDGFNALIGGEK